MNFQNVCEFVVSQLHAYCRGRVGKKIRSLLVFENNREPNTRLISNKVENNPVISENNVSIGNHFFKVLVQIHYSRSLRPSENQVRAILINLFKYCSRK